MPGSTANIEWHSDDAQLIRSLDKVERNMDTLARKMGKVERTSRRSAKATEDAFDKVSTSVKGVGVLLGVGGIIATGYQLWSSANKQVMQEAQEISRKYDEIARKIRIQGGLTKLQTEDAQARLKDLATDAAVPIGEAANVALKLIGGGVGYKSATGGAGAAVLKAVAATNVSKTPIEPEAFVKGIVTYLNSQGQALNEKNIEALTTRMVNLVFNSTVEGETFKLLGAQGGALRGQLSIPEQLAAFTALEKSLDPSSAARHLRGFVEKSAQAAGSPAKVEALKQLGLTPQQVDFVGEGLGEILNTYAAAKARTPEAQANVAMGRIFGLETSSAAGILIKNRASLPGLVKAQTNAARFNRAAKVAAQGMAAGAQRQENEIKQLFAPKAAGDELVKREIRKQMLLQGRSPAAIETAQAFYSAQRLFGISTPEALTTFRTIPGGSNTPLTDVYRGLRQAGRGDIGSNYLEEQISARLEGGAEWAELARMSEEHLRQIAEHSRQEQRTEDAPRVRNPPAAAQGVGIRR